MKIPKVSRVKYKSVKRFKARGLRRLERQRNRERHLNG